MSCNYSVLNNFNIVFNSHVDNKSKKIFSIELT